MKTAFLFPGQGSQKPGMMNELPSHTAVKELLDLASNLLNESVFNFHTVESFASTKAVQLSLFIAGMATFKAFEAEGVKPDFVGGHSVGSFGAAVAAGVIDFEDALKIVKLRGELMEQTYPTGYGMGVVLGMDVHDLQVIVNRYSNDKSPIFVTNQNAPDQLTLSGELCGIKRVLKEAGEKGARCASMLNVHTPSHCSLLAPVSDALTEALQNIEFHRPVIPYVGNRTARLLYNSVDIRLDLAESVSSAVRWHDASSVLYEKGTRLFIEMFPGNVLSRLAVKAFPDARVMSMEENGFDDCLFIAQHKT